MYCSLHGTIIYILADTVLKTNYCESVVRFRLSPDLLILGRIKEVSFLHPSAMFVSLANWHVRRSYVLSTNGT